MFKDADNANLLHINTSVYIKQTPKLVIWTFSFHQSVKKTCSVSVCRPLICVSPANIMKHVCVIHPE